MKISSIRFLPLLTLSACLLAVAAPVAFADTLTALGRVLPQSGVIDIGGPDGDTVTSILVKEGEWVQAGQSLAVLSSAAADAKRVAQSESDLAALKLSTAKAVEIARRSEAAAEVELKFASERYDRTNAARNSEFISPDQIEDRTVAKENAAIKVMQAQDSLTKAQTDAEKSLRAAQTELDGLKAIQAMAEVRSPIKAQVLKTIAHVGTTAGRAPLFKLGDTSSMVVVAEIYQDDALKVKVGQKATISSVALPKKMTGVISSVSGMIFRNSLESLDPNDSSQTRIIEVTIKMDEVEPLDRLVMLQTDVNIAL